MPFALLKSVREVSSEDPAHIAHNLLNPEPNKKWKTKSVGEKSAIVVLELEKPYEITGIDIGNEHSAFVEVLAGNSQDNFTEILITCSFMTPIESKNSSNINRVRCFSQEALVESKLAIKWKLVKVICTQPFNKHVQYGLSFIKLHVSEKPPKKELEPNTLDAEKIKRKGSTLGNRCEEEVKRPNLGLGQFSLREDSPESESESSSGLFNRWKTNRQNVSNRSESIASVIRKASTSSCNTEASLRKFSNITVIPQVINKPHTGNLPNRCATKQVHKDLNDRLPEKKQITTNLVKGQNKQEKETITESKKTPPIKVEKPSSAPVKKINQNMKFRPFNKLLQGVVLVISGIQNPQRADLRNKALAMGAKYKGDWERESTHLICAFKNTPKYNQVKSKGKIVTSKWIDKCYEAKKYLPWRRFALDSEEFSKQESDEEIFDESQRQTAFEEVCEKGEEGTQTNAMSSLTDINEKDDSRVKVRDSSSGSDTDDDIQRVVSNSIQRNMVKRNLDISLNKDEKTQNGDSIYEVLTEEEDFLKDKYEHFASHNKNLICK